MFSPVIFKMKYSVLLLLFLFTSSASVDFGIGIETGGYIWEVPDEWDENSPPTRFELPVEELDEGPSNWEQPQWSIPESGIPELGIVAQGGPELNTHNTYIIFVIDVFHNFHWFYWIGAESSNEKKRSAANTIPLMIRQQFHGMKIPFNELLMRLKREVEGKESKYFKTILRLPEPNKISSETKLYRVAGSTGQFIMQVPLTYNELNGSDSFVLDQFCVVRIWNSLGINEHKLRNAKLLGKRILKIDNKFRCTGRNLLVAVDSIASANRDEFKAFRENFLNELEDVPPSRFFPEEPANYTDEELKLKYERKEELKLYQFVWTPEREIKSEIKRRPLRLNQVESRRAYILVDSRWGNIILYLGRDVGFKTFQKSLVAAEKFCFFESMRNACSQIKFTCQNCAIIPTDFLINFSDAVLNIN